MSGKNCCDPSRFNDSSRCQEAACAQFGVPHGPSTPGCDAFFRGQCSHFRALTRGLGAAGAQGAPGGCGCFNVNIGEQYVCPRVGKAGPDHACKDCHHLRPNNLGEHYICGGSLTEAGMAPAAGSGEEQTGGGHKGYTNGDTSKPLDYSTFIRPVYNRCDGCITMHRRDPLDGPYDYSLANYTDCAGSPIKVRTNYLPSAQCGRNFSTVVEQKPDKVVLETPLMCNGRERCGNGLCSRPLKSNTQGKDGENCCKRFGLATSCFQSLNTAQARASPWVYGSDDIPSWHLDLAGPIVGGRPQWRRGTNNSVPPMMLQNTVNMPNRRFDCRQPCWGPECL